jgi:hypothetical protein
MTVYTEIEILKIIPCGCDAEGNIHIFLRKFSKKLIAYYQGSDSQIAQALPEGSVSNGLIYMLYGNIKKAKVNKKKVLRVKDTNNYKVTGNYRGCVIVNDLELHKIESEFPVLVDPESMNDIRFNYGEWVETNGTFFVDYF